MKKRVVTFMITGFLLCTAPASFADEIDNDKAQQLASFEFVVELGQAGTSFEGHHGTNWLNMNWGAPGGSESSFWIDESGVAASESSMSGQIFLVHVKATAEKIELVSKRGTSWKELSFNSTVNESHRAVVNENGIQSEVFAQ